MSPIRSLPPLDFSTPSGTAIAGGRITFAESELALISDRLGEAGTPPGGREVARRYHAAGRIPVRAEPAGGRCPIRGMRPWFVGLVRRYLASDSFRMLSGWLSAEGIPASFESGFPSSGAARRPCHSCRYAG
jgi:hypothetical protein